MAMNAEKSKNLQPFVGNGDVSTEQYQNYTFVFSYSYSLCVIEKSIDIIPFPNPQIFLTVHLSLLIQNAMARYLNERWGSQKGHIETWHKFS